MLQKSYKHISIVFLLGRFGGDRLLGIGSWQRAAPFGFREQPFAMIYKTVLSDSTVIRLYFLLFVFGVPLSFLRGIRLLQLLLYLLLLLPEVFSTLIFGLYVQADRA